MDKKTKIEKNKDKERKVSNCCCYVDPCGCYMIDPCGCVYIDPCCC